MSQTTATPIAATSAKKPSPLKGTKVAAAAPAPTPKVPKRAPKKAAQRPGVETRAGNFVVKHAQPKPLTVSQLNYSLARLNEISKALIEKRSAKLPAEVEAPKLKFDQQYALIAAGKAKLKPRARISGYTNIEDAFTYPTHERALAKHTKVSQARAAAVERITAAVKAEAQAVADKLALAQDGSAALALLEGFAKLK